MALFWAASFPLVAFALFGVLICYGLSSLITWIAQTLGNIPLLFGFSIPLGDIFYNFVKPVDTWLLGIAVTLFDYLTGPLIGIANMLERLMSNTVSVTATHAGQLAHLHNVTIPAEGRAAVSTAHFYTATQLQAVRDQVHLAQTKWEQAHSYADAVAYINAERTAPSVEHALLAGYGRTLIAAENHAQDLHNQLRDYIGRQITGQADVAAPYTGRTLTGVNGAIAIPTGLPISGLDVQDLIKTGAEVTVGTAVAVIAWKIVDCLVSKCAGNNNFDNLLKDALGILTAVEVGEFLADVIGNPAGVLKKYERELAGLVPAAGNTGQDVVAAIESILAL